MARCFTIKAKGKTLIELNGRISLRDGQEIFDVRVLDRGGSAIKQQFEDIERQFRRSAWAKLEDSIDELLGSRAWLYEGRHYVSYQSIGLPCGQGQTLRFVSWPRRFYSRRNAASHQFDELPDSGCDFAELPMHGYDFAELHE